MKELIKKNYYLMLSICKAKFPKLMFPNQSSLIKYVSCFRKHTKQFGYNGSCLGKCRLWSPS